jgi:hypothetical protein
MILVEPLLHPTWDYFFEWMDCVRTSPYRPGTQMNMIRLVAEEKIRGDALHSRRAATTHRSVRRGFDIYLQSD